MKNKSISILIAVSLLLPASAASTAFAADYNSSPDTNACVANTPECEFADLVRAFEESDWGQKVRAYGSDRSIPSKAVKEAVKWALKNRRAIIKGVSDMIGKEPARRVDQAFDRAVPVLKKMLAQQELIWDTVQKQLTPVLGADLAFWIRCVIEWISPV